VSKYYCLGPIFEGNMPRHYSWNPVNLTKEKLCFLLIQYSVKYGSRSSDNEMLMITYGQKPLENEMIIIIFHNIINKTVGE
jgi:hypothetical protein